MTQEENWKEMSLEDKKDRLTEVRISMRTPLEEEIEVERERTYGSNFDSDDSDETDDDDNNTTLPPDKHVTPRSNKRKRKRT